MKEVKNIYELGECFDIDVDEEETESLKYLIKAIERGKIFVDETNLYCEYPTINFKLNKKIKMSEDGEFYDQISFKCISGEDRKSIQNAKLDKKGDVIHKIICRRTGISQIGLKEQNARDVGLLEDCLTFLC